MATFFTNLFFLLTILAILEELRRMYFPVKYIQTARSLKGKQYEELDKQQKSIVHANLWYFAWCFCGLFLTDVWIVYLLILVMSLVPKRVAWITSLDAAITIALLLFAVIDHYHLLLISQYV
jgi:hypothetical protein